ncbi:MAG: hypothetical protein M1826_003020 [Phylliscum demangeonii]|nr:MAG: hypothetical protein M1826_003020 [Phylliscum demangeonii]
MSPPAPPSASGPTTTLDPHQGGRLEDMAATGTTMPNDAGLYNVLPSVPRPDQIASDDTTYASLADAADNAIDIPRSTRDSGMTGEVRTGTGEAMPAMAVERKHIADGGNEALAKGHPRMAKHAKQLESDLDQLAGDGPGVQPAPGEEDMSQEALRHRRDGV